MGIPRSTARVVVNNLICQDMVLQTDSLILTTTHSSTVMSFRRLQPSISLNTLKGLHGILNPTGRLRTESKQQRTSWKKLLMQAMTHICLYTTSNLVPRGPFCHALEKPGPLARSNEIPVLNGFVNTITNQICQTCLWACAEWREVRESRTSRVGHGQRSRSLSLTKRIAVSGNEMAWLPE